MTENKSVSVNILTYNAQDLIGQCLKSVLGQTYSNIEILVVDNGSEDKTLEKASAFVPQGGTSADKGNFRVIENKENLGFSIGHNIGIRESKGEYVLCLNQDVVLDKDFIKYAVEAMEKDEKSGAVQGKLYKKDKILDTTGLLVYKNRRFVNRGQGEEDKGQYNKTEEIFGVDGAAPLYKRKALEDTKINNEYFDEDFFMYKEDVDLAWRMRLYGWKAVYESGAIGYHLRGAGDGAVRTARAIIKQRRKISRMAKFYSFKNQRLMQIKNELPALFFRDFYCIIIKEIAAWIYVLFFERYGWKAIKELFKQAPIAWRKRKIIMNRKRARTREISKWLV